MSGKPVNSFVRLGLELGPVIVFFVAYGRLKDQTLRIAGADYSGFILVTAGFIPLLALSTWILWRLTGRVSKMQLVTLVLVAVFGGLTIWFNDERFFKMKPTIIYLMFSGVLGLGLMRGQSYLQYAMDEVMPLRQKGWMILTRRMCALFLVLAALNEIVWRTMSTDAWVNFKTFGLTAAVFLFFMTQGKLLEAHRIEGKGQD